MIKRALLALSFGLAFGLIATSCTDKTQVPSGTHKPGYSYANNPVAEQAIADWDVSCAQSTDCPTTVGELILQNGDDTFTCTASLIGDDLMITSRHCLEQSAPPLDDPCA